MFARPNPAGHPLGEPCTDRHGVALPADAQGPLTIRVGLYDEETGERMRWDNGGDFLTLGQVRIGSEE